MMQSRDQIFNHGLQIIAQTQPVIFLRCVIVLHPEKDLKANRPGSKVRISPIFLYRDYNIKK